MSEPVWIVLGPPEHGVVMLAERICSRRQADLAGCASSVRAVSVGELLHSAELEQAMAPGTSAHVHFTDQLFGLDCFAAATAFAELAAALGDHRGTLSVTLHDLPTGADDPARFRRRAQAYQRVVAAATGAVIVSSAHEADLLAAVVADVAPVVIALPVEAMPHSGPAPARHGPVNVSILGFLYPGNGHAEVLEALPSLPAGIGLVALGRVGAGHEALVGELTRRAEELGRSFAVSGWLAIEELSLALRQAAIPILGPRRISASASIGSWLSAGRRPIVPDVPYTRELLHRMPGALTCYAPTPEAMISALGRACADPSSTWLTPEVALGPSVQEVAAAYSAAVCDHAGRGSR